MPYGDNSLQSDVQDALFVGDFVFCERSVDGAASWFAGRRIEISVVIAADEVGAADTSDVFRFVSADATKRLEDAFLWLRHDDVLALKSESAATLEWDARCFAGLDLGARGHCSFGGNAQTNCREADGCGLQDVAASDVWLQFCARSALPLLADAGFGIRLVCHGTKVNLMCVDGARGVSASCQGAAERSMVAVVS